MPMKTSKKLPNRRKRPKQEPDYKKMLQDALIDDFQFAQLLTKYDPSFEVEISQPPTTNRGADDTADYNTFSHNDLKLSFDWLEFTVKDRARFSCMEQEEYQRNGHADLFVRFVITQILELPTEEFLLMPSGAYGYKFRWKYMHGNIVLLAGGSEQQGIHVTLSGDGCRALFSRTTPQKLIENVFRADGNFTRVDLALDDYTAQYYTVDELQGYAQKQEIVTDWHEINFNMGYSASSAEVTKRIVYLGSMKSDYYLRVYDKALEQASKGKAEVPQSWSRWEMVFRRKRAQAVIQEIVQHDFDMGAVFIGLLSDSMRVVHAGADSNRSRWQVTEKWAAFVAAVKPLHLTIEKAERTIDSMKQWIINQVSPSLAAVCCTKGGVAWLFKLLAQVKPSVKKNVKKLVETYNDTHELEVSNDEFFRFYHSLLEVITPGSRLAI